VFPSCDACKAYISTAFQLVELGKHPFSTKQDALIALQVITCATLPPPADLICAGVVVDEDIEAMIVPYIIEKAVEEGYCTLIGACPVGNTTLN